MLAGDTIERRRPIACGHPGLWRNDIGDTYFGEHGDLIADSEDQDAKETSLSRCEELGLLVWVSC